MSKASSIQMPVNAGFAGLFALSLLVAAVPGPAKADAASLDREFCAAIGIEPDAQAQCVADLAAATTTEQRRDTHDKWVANSALANRFWGGSLYEPPVDQNVRNGTPGTPYQSKLLHVSNQTTADIYRALRDDNLYVGPYAR
jgi:hypothetical protein